MFLGVPKSAALLGLLLAVSPVLRAASVVIDFESFNSLDSITNQIPGLTFTDATILTAGVTLNEAEFPPYSGVNVVLDDGGPMTIAFDTPTDSVGGYFNYTEPFTMTAFDASDTEVAVADSLFSSNDALFGDPGSSPDEYISVAWASGISSVVLEADPGGSSFTLDNLTYDASSSSSTPEPGTMALFVLGTTGLIFWRAGGRPSKANR